MHLGSGGVWGSPPGLAPQARNFWAFALLLITKHRAAYCNAPYTHAHCTSKIRARFSSVAFATYLRSVGAAPARSLRGRHWGVPTNGCDHGPPQARLLGVCACFVVKKGRAFCIECIALCSLDAPETRNLSWRGRVPNEAACIALNPPRSMLSWRMEAQHTRLRPFTCACGATPSGHFGRTGNTTRTQEGARESFDFTQHARRTAGS